MHFVNLYCLQFSFLEDNEQLRQDFADKANQAGAYIDAKSATLSDLSMQGQGSLEEQLQSLKSFQQEVLGYQPMIDECETSNQAAQAALVFDNPHTKYTMEVRMYIHVYQMKLQCSLSLNT